MAKLNPTLEAVTRRIEKAIEASRPRRRYIAWWDVPSAWAFEATPAWVTDTIFSVLMGRG